MSTNRVAVIDYEVGNLRSVLNALAAAGASPELLHDPTALPRFNKVLLPGVGAFGPGMAALRGFDLISALAAHVDAGRPLLGICLGMQLLCRTSLEYGHHTGLGWIDAAVVPLADDPTIKVPHIGWNHIRTLRDSPLLAGIEDGSDVYFNHSFVVQCRDSTDSLAETEHGGRFSSMVQRGRVFGAQFHPEKSQAVGLQLLRNFVALP